MKGIESGIRRYNVVLVAAIALALSACGGGGGGMVKPPPVEPSGPPAPPPPPAPAPAPAPPADQPPTDAQIVITNTKPAHDQGFVGTGITIGVVDSGIMRSNPTVSGRVKQELIYVDPGASNTAIDDVVGHGTWVAGIAAGKEFDQFAGGIAPGASLVSARIISDVAPPDDGSGNGNKVTADDAAFFGQTLNPDLIAAGVQVMNNSWGGIYWDTTDATINKAFADAYRPFVVQHGGLVVFAAGNESQDDPSDIAALPTLDGQLEQGWLVAVAVDSNHPDQLASYSNACGKAMDYCLAAPGDVIVLDKDATSSSTDPDYYIVQGTSFAAPMVSGAAAVVWQAFPYFTNDLVRQTLLGTADDLGDPGPDPVFGYGELNVGKAVNGPGRFDWGDVTVNFTGESTWSNPISGAGGLIKQGSGTLNLTKPSTYGGTTRIEGGVLTAAALAGTVNIDAQGTLSGTPTIGGGINNAGVLVVAGGDVEVAGNYTQKGAGRLSLSLGSALRVTGTADITGGDLYVTGTDSGYVVDSHTDVLTAAGGLTGTFSALNKGPNVTLLTATLNYDANSAWLDVSQVQVTAVQGMSYTPASFGAAQRVQGAFDQINTQLGPAAPSGIRPASASFIQGAGSLQHSSSIGTVQDSLRSLSGELHAASAAMTLQAIDAGTRALSNHFDDLLDHPQTGGWTQNLGYHGDLSRSGYSNVGVDLSGWLVGQDFRGNGNGVAGYAISQSQGLGRLADSFDQGRSHALEGMLYGGVIHGSWYTMGRLGMGSYRESMRRQVQLGDQFARVASRVNGRYGVAYGESGYRLSLGRTEVTPYLNLQYAQLQRDGFDEMGAYGFGLKSPAQSTALWRAGLGLRASRSWMLAGGGSLSLQTRMLWQQSFGVRGELFDASFSGINQFAPVGGIGLSRYGGVAGTTLDWTMNPHASLQLGYDRSFGQRQQGQMGTLSFNWAF